MTDAPKNCTTCAFKAFCGKTDYCTLHNQAIINLDVGCSRHMYKSEFTSGEYSSKLYITAKEIQAATEARKINEGF